MGTKILNASKIVGKYLVIVVGGTTLFLILSPLSGYLPYSDRPGPGWHSEPFHMTLSDFIGNAQFMLSWALFLSLYAIAIGLILLGLARLLEHFRLNRIAVSIICSVISGFLSAYIVLGIGWYIAISSAAINVSLVLGLIFGAFVLPKKNRATVTTEVSGAS